MKRPNLLVRITPPSMVPDYDAMAHGVRRFIGWTFEPPGNGNEHGRFIATLEPVSIPFKNEYLRAMQEGDLIPADQATASLIGVSLSKQ